MPGLVMVMLPLFPLAGYEAWVWCRGGLDIFDHSNEMKQNKPKNGPHWEFFSQSAGLRASRRFRNGFPKSEEFFRSHPHS